MGKKLKIVESKKPLRPAKKKSTKENADAALSALAAEDDTKLIMQQINHMLATTEPSTESLF